MGRIKDDIRDLERFEEIVDIVLEEECGYILDVLDIQDHIPVLTQLTAKRQSKPRPERLRETFEELGTTFIKFGQIMAERPDIVPREYAKELEKLQDSAPSFGREKAKKIVEEQQHR
ncbi:MAG: AarF/ABC1/UbiB kinase family protein, partial [Candidatus Nanohaloarchaea archaeon]